MKRMKQFMILFFVICIIAGCGVNNQGRDNNQNFGVQNVRNNDNNNQTRMQVADEAQNKIKDLDEVRRANVIVANRNAYVAVVLDDQPKGELRREVENKISDQVKSTDPNIENVFVSSNPDFVDRMTDYGDKLQGGRPVQGLFEEFMETVGRVFPNAR